MTNVTNQQVRVAADGSTFVATYGSLRRGMQNFPVNANGGGVFLAKGKTAENFDLYRYGGLYFPSVSLKHNSSEKPVVVDVFEVPLGGLTGPYDRLEGYPGFYDRHEVDINLDDGSTLKAWIYHIDEEQDNRVESGDWCTFNRPNYYEELESSSSDEA